MAEFTDRYADNIDRGENPRNEQSTLFKNLTRLFSGPIVSYDKQTARKLKRQSLEKHKNQFKSLSGQSFKKSEHNPFRYLHHERLMNRNRAERYIDFDQMEYDPILNSALDIYADEITTATQMHDTLQIDCENERIRSVLRTLYYDILNIEHNLFGWVRTMCKYGDFFLYLDVDEQHGVTDAIGLPTHELERLEGLDENNPKYTQFQWNSAGMTFERWQVSHFRILGNDKYNPYGTCVKKDSRISTLEGMKEIQDIERGDKVYSFDTDKQKKVAAEVKDKVCNGVKPIIKIQTDHNYLEVTENHKVLTFNEGEYKYKFVGDLTVNDNLVVGGSRKDEGQEIDIPKQKPENNKNGYWNSIGNLPDKVTKEFAELFGFMIGDGWVHSQNSTVHLAYGEHDGINDKYFTYLSKFSGKDVKYRTRPENEKYCSGLVHSKMLKTVLERMGFEGDVYTKRIPDWVYESKPEIRRAFLNGLVEADGSEYTDEWDCTRYQLELANEQLVKDAKYLAQTLGLQSGKIMSRQRENQIIEGREVNAKESFYFYFYDSENTQMKKYMPSGYKAGKEDYIVEPIRSIEEAGEEEVYDIHVEGEDKEYHNFYANGVCVHNSVLEPARRIWRQLVLLEDAVMAYRIVRSPERRVFYIDVGGIDASNVEDYIQETVTEFKRHTVVDEDTGQVDLRYDPMSIEEDYYIPTRGADDQTRIEKLKGGEYTGDIDDVKYLRDKLLTAIKIPQPYLTYGDDASDDQSSLAQKDIRFARTIQRLQKAVLGQLRKIGVVHLFTLGFDDEDLMAFDLSLNNPSRIAEMQELEQWRTKLDVGSMMSEQNMFSEWKVADEIYGMSEEEFMRQRKQKIHDAKYSKELTEIEEGEMLGEEGLGGELGGLGEEGEEELGGDLEEEPFGGEEEEPGEEGELLSAPEGEEEPAKRDDEAYETPRSKGKKYKPETSDKRDMGARKRSQLSKGGERERASSRRKKIPGMQAVNSLKDGIYEEEEKELFEEKLARTENDTRELIKELKKEEEEDESQ